MNKESPTADAPVPPAGTEQAADQGIKQQPPPGESGVMDTIATVIDGVTDAAGIAADILSVFD